MFVTPSRFQWNKTKDLAHFYTLLGAIPVGLIVFYCNVFIGPATLTPTPENYTPKHWEYHRVYKYWLFVCYCYFKALNLQHPITRFIARYLLASPQQEYEKVMHTLYEEEEKRQL
jgi:NADH dehydrogenase (ubiquinone) 1 beta subcomplex subunit 5